VSIPRGFAGNSENPRALMREKFVRCAAPVIGEERAEEVAVKVENLEWLSANGVADLLRFGLQ
jgi:hypothetical protein